jgi:hypothetical protein
MSLSLLIAMAFSVPTVSAAPAYPVPRADIERCAAYYLALTEETRQSKDSKLSGTTGLWASGLAVAMAREGSTPAEINAHLLALVKESATNKPDPALRAVCEADVVTLQATAAAAKAPAK